MPIIIALLLVIISGLVAAAGDYMGQRAARRKVRIGKLRPRYVSRLIAVISGVLISLATYGAMFFLYSDFREALTQYSTVKARYEEASKQRDAAETELKAAQDKTQEANDQRAKLQTEVDQVQQNQIKLVEQMDATRKEYDASQVQLAESRRQEAETKRRVASAETELKQTNAQLKSAKAEVSKVRGQSVASTIRLDKLRHENILMDSDTPLARIEIKGADAGQREALLRGALQSARQILADQLGLKTDDAAEAELANFIQNYPYAEPAQDAIVEIVTAANVVAGDSVPVKFRARPIKPLIAAGQLLLALHVTDEGMRIEPRGRKARTVTFKNGVTGDELVDALNIAGAEFDEAMEQLGFIPPAGLSPQELAQAVGQVAAQGDILLTHERPYVIQIAAKDSLKSTDWPLDVVINIFTEPGH